MLSSATVPAEETLSSRPMSPTLRVVSFALREMRSQAAKSRFFKCLRLGASNHVADATLGDDERLG